MKVLQTSNCGVRGYIQVNGRGAKEFQRYALFVDTFYSKIASLGSQFCMKALMWSDYSAYYPWQILPAVSRSILDEMMR